jgi:hypothetical protein
MYEYMRKLYFISLNKFAEILYEIMCCVFVTSANHYLHILVFWIYI